MSRRMGDTVISADMHPRTSELLSFLDGQRAILKSAADSVAESARDVAPAPGRWSAAGIVEHLAIIERRLAVMLGTRIAEARASGDFIEMDSRSVLSTIDLGPVLDRIRRVKAPESAHPTGLAFPSAWDALGAAGDRIRQTLRDADGLALERLTAPHPIFGPLTFYQWFAFVGAHEARHAAQILEDYQVSTCP